MTESSAQAHPPRRRILIVKLGAIGDVIMVVPAARALHLAGYDIDWICGRGVLPLLSLYPWIRAVPIDDRALITGGWLSKVRTVARAWRLCIGIRYELCAILYYDRRYRVLTWLARAEQTVLLSPDSRDRNLLPGRHHTDEYARILLSAVGRRTDGETPSSLVPLSPAILPPFPSTKTAGTRRMVLCPGGARNMLRDNPLRRWPLDRYVAVAKDLLAQGHEVVLIGGADDAWVLPSFEGLAALNQIGKLSLVETLTLLDDSDILISHDTGPLHMAGITRIAILAIFGPTDPGSFLPRRSGVRAIWGGQTFACRPCYDGRDFAACKNNGCMQTVQVGAVLNAVADILNERNADRAVTSASSIVSV